MNPDDALNILADRFGILPDFHDLSGHALATSRETKLALLRANGLVLDNDAMVFEALEQHQAAENARQFPTEIITANNYDYKLNVPTGSGWELLLETGNQTIASGISNGQITLPPLPSGIHELQIETASGRESIAIIASPASAPQVDHIAGQPRVWGVTAALYGLRSERQSGLGDFEDLARLAELIGGNGGSFLGINPVHNLGWADVETISPYSPSHRGFLNTDHIAADRIIGLEGVSENGASPEFSADMLDYGLHRQHQHKVLGKLFVVFKDQASQSTREQFAAFCAEQGENLAQFALYEALSEVHGPDWRRWPDHLQSPEMAAKQRVDNTLQKQIEFHSWLQWQADCQLATAQTRGKQAGMGLGLYLDLAVGPRRGAAETWCEADTVARGASIGAPPDHLSPAGQNWDLAAFAPARLMVSKYKALRNILRQTMRHAAVLRIDHILGTNRSYWIPDDGSPGGYIKQPFHSLLALIAIEAERANTVVVGEDLGLVPDGFRETVSARGLYGYSVLQYETDDHGAYRRPADLRPQSLACFSTHDTPTLQGFWQGRDIEWWQKLGWINDEQADHARIHRHYQNRGLLSLDQDQITGTLEGRSFADLSQQVHGALAVSPAAMVSVQLDDILGQVEAQNLPGTILKHPNWRRRSDVAVDALQQNESLQEISRIMVENDRGTSASIQKDDEHEH